MKRNRKPSRSSQRTIPRPPAPELPPDRAFVLHLDVRAQLPRRVVGRIEHVTSGQVAHVTSLRELVAFMAKMLRNQGRDEPETADATHVQEPWQSAIASSAPGSLDEDAALSAAQPTLRGRKRGGEQ